MIITSANIDWCTRFFYYRIPEETLYVTIQGIPPHLSCVATLPWKIQKSKITAERLLMPSKLLGFILNLTKLKNI